MARNKPVAKKKRLGKAGKEINYEGIAGTQDWNKYGDPITYLQVVKQTTKSPNGIKRIGTVTPDMIKSVIDCVLNMRAKRQSKK